MLVFELVSEPSVETCRDRSGDCHCVLPIAHHDPCTMLQAPVARRMMALRTRSLGVNAVMSGASPSASASQPSSEVALASSAGWAAAAPSARAAPAPFAADLLKGRPQPRLTPAPVCRGCGCALRPPPPALPQSSHHCWSAGLTLAPFVDADRGAASSHAAADCCAATAPSSGHELPLGWAGDGWGVCAPFCSGETAAVRSASCSSSPLSINARMRRDLLSSACAPYMLLWRMDFPPGWAWTQSSCYIYHTCRRTWTRMRAASYKVESEIEVSEAEACVLRCL